MLNASWDASQVHNSRKLKQGCVVLWPCHFEKYLKAKEELCKLKYFTMQKYMVIFKKHPLKETKIYITL
jgi:hypothetical protein